MRVVELEQILKEDIKSSMMKIKTRDRGPHDIAIELVDHQAKISTINELWRLRASLIKEAQEIEDK
jgi:hypothetical protein